MINWKEMMLKLFTVIPFKCALTFCFYSWKRAVGFDFMSLNEPAFVLCRWRDLIAVGSVGKASLLKSSVPLVSPFVLL